MLRVDCNNRIFFAIRFVPLVLKHCKDSGITFGSSGDCPLVIVNFRRIHSRTNGQFYSPKFETCLLFLGGNGAFAADMGAQTTACIPGDPITKLEFVGKEG